MSRDGFSLPSDAGAEQAPDAGAPEPSAHRADMSLRQQVLGIIDVALAGTDADGEWARKQLRDLLQARPDDPEGALLEHLIATRLQTTSPADAPVPPEPDPARAGASEKPRTVPVPFGRDVRKRIQTILRDKLLLTAFQPINELPAGRVIGVEALTRFVGNDGASADVWFSEASAVGLGTDLEIAALHCALKAARDVPRDVFVAFNLTPATCCDPRVGATLAGAHLAPDRIVVEVTGALAPAEGQSWSGALESLRKRGLRIAVSASGDGSASLDELAQLRPDIIKLDRRLIGRILDFEGQARATSIVALARRIGATVVAEGIETQDELAAVSALDVTAGQGYLLGRPSIQPLDWSAWTIRPRQSLRLLLK